MSSTSSSRGAWIDRLPPPPDSRGKSLAATVTVLGLLGVVGAALLLSFGFRFGSYNAIGAVLTLAGLLVVNLPLLARAGRAETDPRIRLVIAVAFGVQLAACLVRYYMVVDLYSSGDSLNYFSEGSRLADAFREGNFTPELGGGSPATQALRYITGLVLAVTGPTMVGAFFVFSVISYWGLYGCYRAFKLSVPEGDHFRYAWLVLLLPSLVFWPSSIGKDAWMLGMLGLVSVGAAKVFLHRSGGYLPLLLGLAGTYLIRPHLAAIVLAAVLAGFLRRPRRGRPPLLGPLGQLIGVALLIMLGFVAMTRVASTFQLDESASVAATVTDVLAETGRRTTAGSSEIEAAPLTSLLQLPRGVLTVLFRPFPHEARNLQMLVTSLEGVFLLGLFVFSLPRMRSLPRYLLNQPYVRYAVVFTLLFVMAWSSIGNLGILARQRVQVLPFALVLVALPRERAKGPMSLSDSPAARPTAVNRA